MSLHQMSLHGKRVMPSPCFPVFLREPRAPLDVLFCPSLASIDAHLLPSVSVMPLILSVSHSLTQDPRVCMLRKFIKFLIRTSVFVQIHFDE